MKNYNMKSLYFKIIVVAVFVFNTNTIVGQEEEKEINSEVVRIKTSYSPIILDAFKIKLNPKDVDVKFKKNNINYRLKQFPVYSDFKLSTGKLKPLAKKKLPSNYDSYISVAYGNYNTPEVKAFVKKTFKNQYLGLYAYHKSTKDGVNNSLIDYNNSKTVINTFYNTYNRKYIWNIDAKYDVNSYNWYGFPTIAYDEQTFSEDKQEVSNISFKVDFDNISDYLIDKTLMDIYFISDKYDSSELYYSLNSYFNLLDESNHSIDISLPLSYTKTNFGSAVSEELKKNNLTLLSVKPSYKYNNNGLGISLGFNATYMKGEYNKGFFFYPEIKLSKLFNDSKMNMELGLSGGLNHNSYKKLINDYRYVSPDLVLKTTNLKNKFYIRTKGDFGKFAFSLEASYLVEEDKALFVQNKYNYLVKTDIPQNPAYGFGNSYKVIYSDIKSFVIDMKLDFELSKNTKIGMQNKTYYYTLDENETTWNLPTSKMKVFAEYKPKNWLFNIDIILEGSLKDKLTTYSVEPLDYELEIEAFVDANIHIEYFFTTNFSVFMKVENAFDQNYNFNQNYGVQGFKALGGLVFKFDVNK